ncbi:chromosome partitioning protein [Cribrihabitans marinus]|uniref:Chromosome partitioning protein n=1 Tax=Cribrihabitans marinus TaxID=1227549 RepID=A0A1H7DXS8_9RHOB|nr:AAA family ATPase [Cribrihabitans marinus]GGH41124.1 ATPase ParA type [Cribrihabitans marinus]SEK06536.1 chromosome partitioning protein [Cribrihabitans marinus]
MKRPAYLAVHPASHHPVQSESVDLRTIADFGAACEAIAMPLQTNRTQVNGSRLFSTWEITRYLIPVDPVHLRRVLRQNPDLPQGKSRGEAGSKWFSLQEVRQLKAFFASTGTKARAYLPYRPPGLPPCSAVLANSTAESGKTTTCAHLAMAAAQDGYRVLAIDLDARGGLTRLMGAETGEEWQTVLPLVGRHYVEHLQMLNRLRLERGETPVPIEAGLERALGLRPSDLAQPTRWPGVDVIAAGPDLSAADLRIAGWRLQARTWKFWTSLASALTQDSLSDRYDLILFDTPPALGHLSMAGMAAAQALLVPLRARPQDLAETGRFMTMLGSAFGTVEEDEALAARAIGGDPARFSWEAVRAVLTRHDPARESTAAEAAQAALGSLLWSDRLPDSPFVTQTRAIYDTDYRETNRETYAAAREGVDAIYAAFKRLMVDSWQRAETVEPDTMSGAPHDG